MKTFVVTTLALVLGSVAAVAAPDSPKPDVGNPEAITPEAITPEAIKSEPPGPKRTCTAIAADLATARAANKLADAVALYEEAAEAASGCEPKQVFCMGRGVALAHVEVAYDSLEKNKLEDATKILKAGHAFGEPWTLMVAIGDDLSGRARAKHDPTIWSDASVAYQKAYSALAEPSLCPGEPPLPNGQAMDQIVGKLSVATLLAKPLVFFHSKCAPCNLVFLTQGAVASHKPRVLPVTFADGTATITPEGQQTLAALSDCLVRQKWSSIELSAHTDERGSQPFNLRLSQQRLDSVKKVLVDHGFAGRFDGQPKGKSEPMMVEDHEQLTPAEAQRLERRVELRAATGEPAGACFADAPPPNATPSKP